MVQGNLFATYASRFGSANRMQYEFSDRLIQAWQALEQATIEQMSLLWDTGYFVEMIRRLTADVVEMPIEAEAELAILLGRLRRIENTDFSYREELYEHDGDGENIASRPAPFSIEQFYREIQVLFAALYHGTEFILRYKKSKDEDIESLFSSVFNLRSQVFEHALVQTLTRVPRPVHFSILRPAYNEFLQLELRDRPTDEIGVNYALYSGGGEYFTVIPVPECADIPQAVGEVLRLRYLAVNVSELNEFSGRHARREIREAGFRPARFEEMEAFMKAYADEPYGHEVVCVGGTHPYSTEQGPRAEILSLRKGFLTNRILRDEAIYHTAKEGRIYCLVVVS